MPAFPLSPLDVRLLRRRLREGVPPVRLGWEHVGRGVGRRAWWLWWWELFVPLFWVGVLVLLSWLLF